MYYTLLYKTFDTETWFKITPKRLSDSVIMGYPLCWQRAGERKYAPINYRAHSEMALLSLFFLIKFFSFFIFSLFLNFSLPCSRSLSLLGIKMITCMLDKKNPKTTHCDIVMYYGILQYYYR